MKNQWYNIVTFIAQLWLTMLQLWHKGKGLPVNEQLPLEADSNAPSDRMGEEMLPDESPEPVVEMPEENSLSTSACFAVGASYMSGQERSQNSQVLSLLRLDLCHCTRTVHNIVLHCSDTRPSQSFDVAALEACHRKAGFGKWPGYHVYITRDGLIHYTRPVNIKGCHVKDHNWDSVGVCYEGGHSDSGKVKYEDNRTQQQRYALHQVVKLMHQRWPSATICGHNDFNRGKACPCFDAMKEFAYVQADL